MTEVEKSPLLRYTHPAILKETPMDRIAHARWLVLLALLPGLIGAAVPAAAQGTAVPLPDVKGPIPVTATSYPLMASDKLQTLVDLPKAGYVEEEFFITGRANIYDWAPDGGVVVKTPNAPYTTRILLRRPSNPQRFSGNLIVDISNSARRFDFAFAWGVAHDYFLENGDAFVLFTFSQGNLEGLKAFDATRYAPLSLPNPTPDEACVVGRAGGPPQTSTSEEGLVYDILSQIAALLKAARPGGPMAGFNVQRAYMTGYDSVQTNYMVAIHPRARLTNGRPVYDGYVANRNPALGRLRRCGVAPAADDPRSIVRNVDVPVIRLVPETDVLTLYRFRREDSDAPGDRYRLYEVAGGAHADGRFYPYEPSVEVLRKIGSPYAYLASWPFHNQCEPEMLLQKTPINTYAMDAAFANLTRWVRDGVAPPKAARISVENGGTPQARVVRDQYGNAGGGYRTPYLDVPAATYVTSAKGETFCPELGRTDAFSWARLVTVHGTPQNYAAKVAKSADQMVKDRWLTESDGKKIKAEAMSPAVSSSN
jgi:hypothetical protein